MGRPADRAFSAANKGWTVKYTLLPFDNSVNSAKLTAAFGSHNVPDMMNLYSGQFTTTYAKQLLDLRPYINKTPGRYKSIGAGIWNMFCTPDYNCAGGKNTILGVPWNSGAYFMYYNKALLAKAGLSKPPATYAQLFKDCKTLKAAGIVPVAMGAKDGYDTSNLFTTNLGSTLRPGDLAKVLKRQMPYDAPALVAALEPILKLTDPSTGCTSPDALGQDQLQGTQYFQAGKAAMTPYFSLALTTLQKALGKNLGIAKLPLSGKSALLHTAGGYPGNPFDGWVIPKDAKNADMAWNFIKLASDATANKSAQKLMGFSPAVTSVQRGLTDPLQKAAAALAANPSIPELDQVMPSAIANFLYRQFGLAQEGKQSAKQTMSAIETYAKSQGG